MNHMQGLPPRKVAAAYAWKDDKTLELTIRYIESPPHGKDPGGL